MSDRVDLVVSAQAAMMEALNWLYDNGIEKDFVGLAGAESLAEEYRENSKCACKAIDSLIDWQTVNAGAAGFVTGLGGLLVLPVTVTANIASTTYLQLRMVAAIAHLSGHDIRSDKVKSLVFACLVGGGMAELLRDAGVAIGTRFAKVAIASLSGATLKAINQAVGFRLIAKAGATAPINLGKMVPLVGGIVSAGLDAAYIRAIGAAAKMVFAPECGGVPESCSMAMVVEGEP